MHIIIEKFCCSGITTIVNCVKNQVPKNCSRGPSLAFSMNINNVAMLTRQALGDDASPEEVRCDVSKRLRQYFDLLPSGERNAYFVRAGCTPDEAAIESAFQGASGREGFPTFATTKSTNTF